MELATETFYTPTHLIIRTCFFLPHAILDIFHLPLLTPPSDQQIISCLRLHSVEAFASRTPKEKDLWNIGSLELSFKLLRDPVKPSFATFVGTGWIHGLPDLEMPDYIPLYAMVLNYKKTHMVG